MSTKNIYKARAIARTWRLNNADKLKAKRRDMEARARQGLGGKTAAQRSKEWRQRNPERAEEASRKAWAVRQERLRLGLVQKTPTQKVHSPHTERIPFRDRKVLICIECGERTSTGAREGWRFALSSRARMICPDCAYLWPTEATSRPYGSTAKDRCLQRFKYAPLRAAYKVPAETDDPLYAELQTLIDMVIWTPREEIILDAYTQGLTHKQTARKLAKLGVSWLGARVGDTITRERVRQLIAEITSKIRRAHTVLLRQDGSSTLPRLAPPVAAPPWKYPSSSTT